MCKGSIRLISVFAIFCFTMGSVAVSYAQIDVRVGLSPRLEENFENYDLGQLIGQGIWMTTAENLSSQVVTDLTAPSGSQCMDVVRESYWTGVLWKGVIPIMESDAVVIWSFSFKRIDPNSLANATLGSALTGLDGPRILVGANEIMLRNNGDDYVGMGTSFFPEIGEWANVKLVFDNAANTVDAYYRSDATGTVLMTSGLPVKEISWMQRGWIFQNGGHVGNHIYIDDFYLAAGDDIYLFNDFDKDSNVNLTDYAALANSWMNCNDPLDPLCD